MLIPSTLSNPRRKSLNLLDSVIWVAPTSPIISEGVLNVGFQAWLISFSPPCEAGESLGGGMSHVVYVWLSAVWHQTGSRRGSMKKKIKIDIQMCMFVLSKRQPRQWVAGIVWSWRWHKKLTKSLPDIWRMAIVYDQPLALSPAIGLCAFFEQPLIIHYPIAYERDLSLALRSPQTVGFRRGLALCCFWHALCSMSPIRSYHTDLMF